ncbi:YdiU family protein [Microbacterium sp. HMWF026]|uniref:protein adenylyltransferase SelO n=1 Tax=Microbacterium sp. HMWF026 TaxID=2056861 RepID=UPI002159FA96|nr:protein adenylyltransferase SelO family protein [Microbacterium sp. HMWF026]
MPQGFAPNPRVLAVNEPLAYELGIDPVALHTAEGARFLTGASRAPGSSPVAQVYAGHQWGVFRPVLGDGRAALFGERRDRSGALRDIHAKGIGPTSMSRVDGFATVGPMLREFLLGEAMHALALPTTRALAVTATGTPRSLGGVTLPGAVLVRTARSHIRYGSFEYATRLEDRSVLRRLADLTIARHYPDEDGAAQPYRRLLARIVDAVADQTAGWMGAGFVHGVLSTDNVLVSGETIDYGPCAFLDAYDPDVVFSSIDRHGRYAFGRQPSIMRWNLDRLGEALAPLLAADVDDGRALAREVVAAFDGLFRERWIAVFRAKLGLGPTVDASAVEQTAQTALAILADNRADFPRFWRALGAAARGDRSGLLQLFAPPARPRVEAWADEWRALGPDAALSDATNPAIVPRNQVVEDVLGAAVEGDLGPFDELVALLRDPFVSPATPLAEKLAALPPDTASPFVTYCGT